MTYVNWNSIGVLCGSRSSNSTINIVLEFIEHWPNEKKKSNDLKCLVFHDMSNNNLWKNNN